MGTPNKTATASSAPSVDPLLGREIGGRFKILSVIARGGMGKVYRAEQSPLGRVVALKVLNPNYSGESDPEFHKRFFLEASIVSRLSHGNTVTLYDYGQTDDGVYYMAMELLEGRTLHRRLRDEGPVDASVALHVALQVCRSLREAHGLGVIHRDLKPANIFLIQRDDDRDFVKVLDFGLVKLTDTDGESLTQTGLFMGSPKYMAPEQIRGERVSPATDVYSLGVILFEMLTGRVPFDKPNSVNLLMAHVSDPVPAMREVRPEHTIPGAVEDLVYRCLSKRPEDRFATMDELIAELKRAAAGALPPGALLSGTGEFLGAFTTASGEHPARASHLPSATPPALPAAARSPLPPPLPRLEEAIPSITAEPLPTLPRAVPASSSRLSPIALAMVALGALTGAGVYAATRRPPPPPALRLRAAPAPTAAPPEPTISVAIDSDPSGAEVFEGDRLLGRTPLRESWRGDPSTRHVFTLRAEGYEPTTLQAEGLAIAHAVRLRPLSLPDAGSAEPTLNARRTPRGRPPRPRAETARPSGEPTPEGYRNDVY